MLTAFGFNYSGFIQRHSGLPHDDSTHGDFDSNSATSYWTVETMRHINVELSLLAKLVVSEEIIS